MLYINSFLVLASAGFVAYVLHRTLAFFLPRIFPQRNHFPLALAASISLIGFATVIATPSWLVLVMIAATVIGARMVLAGRAQVSALTAPTALLAALMLGVPFLDAPWHVAIDGALILVCMGGFLCAQRFSRAALDASFILPALTLIICDAALLARSMLVGGS